MLICAHITGIALRTCNAALIRCRAGAVHAARVNSGTVRSQRPRLCRSTVIGERAQIGIGINHICTSTAGRAAALHNTIDNGNAACPIAGDFLRAIAPENTVIEHRMTWLRQGILNVAQRATQTGWRGIPTERDILENGAGTFVENRSAPDVGRVPAEGNIRENGVAVIAEHPAAAVGSITAKGDVREHGNAVLVVDLIQHLIVHSAARAARCTIPTECDVH